MTKGFDRAGLVLGLLLMALGFFVAGDQCGIWWARTHLFAPVTMHAKCPPPQKCLPFKYHNGGADNSPCELQPPCYFTDDAGRQMYVRVRGDEAQPYYPTQERTP